MEGFYGMHVLSRRFGEGTLREWDGQTVTVAFANRSVRFWFPLAFECGELEAADEQGKLYIRATVDEWVSSLIGRLRGHLSVRVLKQRELSYMVERVGKALHGCYSAEEIEQRILRFRDELHIPDAEIVREESLPEEPKTPFRAFLRRHVRLFAILPFIGFGILTVICILAPLGSVAQIFGMGLGTGYDSLQMMSVSFEAGIDVPVILSIVYAGLCLLCAALPLILPTTFGKIGYDIFGSIVSFAAFATGIGEAAYVGMDAIGAFAIVLIVFGIILACYYAVLTAFHALFQNELSYKFVQPSDIDEYGIYMLYSLRKTATKTQKK